MASTINASNSSTTGLITTADNSGALQLQVNNGTPSITLATTGAVGVGSTPAYGSANQALISNGSSAAPSWGSVSLSAGVTGTLPIANGGTGATTLAGANIAVTNATNSFTAQQTFTGSSSSAGAKLIATLENVTVSATAATGTINYDVTTQSVLYYTTNSSGNFVVNLRGSSGTTLNTLLAIGDAVTVAFLVTNGSPAYYNTSVQVDGTTSGVTTRWQGGTAPSAGNASSVDIYSYTVIKTANATFSVFASQTKFA